MFDNYADVMTVDELKEVLRIGRNAAYELIKNGSIKHIRVGKKILIPKQNVIDFLQSNT